MPGLPAQLPWRRFVCVLKSLGYQELSSKAGAARSFHNPNGQPPVVTFHEPHKGDTLRLGTLSEYLRKLQLSREEFLDLLRHC